MISRFYFRKPDARENARGKGNRGARFSSLGQDLIALVFAKRAILCDEVIRHRDYPSLITLCYYYRIIVSVFSRIVLYYYSSQYVSVNRRNLFIDGRSISQIAISAIALIPFFSFYRIASYVSSSWPPIFSLYEITSLRDILIIEILCYRSNSGASDNDANHANDVQERSMTNYRGPFRKERSPKWLVIVIKAHFVTSLIKPSGELVCRAFANDFHFAFSPQKRPCAYAFHGPIFHGPTR